MLQDEMIEAVVALDEERCIRIAKELLVKGYSNQEIASLLGETAAETKIALTKLKESITDE